MVSDVPVDDEAPVVTSGIFRSAGAQSFGGAHRGRVCVRVFIGCECSCMLWASSLYCVILKKRRSFFWPTSEFPRGDVFSSAPFVG